VYVRHQIGIDPADHAGVHIIDLKQVVDRRIAGNLTAVDEIPQSPIHTLHKKTTPTLTSHSATGISLFSDWLLLL
tara:strand:- start:363 stop:587 length:225 start_codon:yes stop_codon:yes gene_type:complete